MVKPNMTPLVTVSFDLTFFDVENSECLPCVVWDTVELKESDSVFDVLLRALVEIVTTGAHKTFNARHIDPSTIRVRFYVTKRPEN